MAVLKSQNMQKNNQRVWKSCAEIFTCFADNSKPSGRFLCAPFCFRVSSPYGTRWTDGHDA